MTWRFTTLLLLSLFTLGCPAPSEGEGEGEGEGEVSDESARYMADDVFLEVAIEMDPGEFEILRNQARDGATLFAPGCREQPFASPFTYFEGNVTIAGIPDTAPIAFENVGVRKKGFFGSVIPEKPSFKISSTNTFPIKRCSASNDSHSITNAKTPPSFAPAWPIASLNERASPPLAVTLRASP